jgi:GGDEF domain-containing protein
LPGRLPGSVRNYDYVGRYGADEFLIVLTHCTPPDLIVTAERMRFHVSEKPVAVDSELIDVTISIGVSAQRSPATELPREEDLVRAGCAALYSQSEWPEPCRRGAWYWFKFVRAGSCSTQIIRTFGWMILAHKCHFQELEAELS